MEKSRNPIENVQWLRLNIELEEVMEELFRDCPVLCGFSLDRSLTPVDVACSARLHGTTLANLRESIEVVVAELVKLRPEARELLSDRTFARRLH